MIKYYVESHTPNAHLFNIRMIIEKPNPDGQIISMPNWIPGSYLFRDYAAHIVTIEAFAGHKKSKINLAKIDSDTWRCENTSEELITIEYTVYAWDLTVEGAYIDQTHAFFNGCALFLVAQQQENQPCRVKIFPPNCPEAKNWHVATTLTRIETAEWEFGEYSANSYQELIDQPVMIGELEILEFKVLGVTHFIIISGKHDGDVKRLVKDITKICETHIKFFNEKPPFAQFMFLVAVLKGDEGGGLEHSYSTAIMIERDSFPILGDSSTNEDYIYLLSLFSHEYFHTWNVKRIKPMGFMPYDLNVKNYTTQLWAFEGVTSYYGDLALVRSKVIKYGQYLNSLAKTITKLLRTPGRKKQTVAEASFDVWTKYNKPDENSLNAIVNFYVKGQLVGLTIDLAMRLTTNNISSLDDVMRYLWTHYGKINKGVPEGQIDNIVVQLGGDSLADLVYDALYTTKELPLEELLAEFGLNLTLRSALTKKERTGKGLGIRAHQKYSFKQGILGCYTYHANGRIYISHVIEDSPACRAGMSASDELVAINDIRVDNYSLDKITKRLRVGQTISIHVFRQDLLYKLSLTLSQPPADQADISLPKNISAAQKKNIALWLSGL